jgi:hypothetical protein
MLLSVTVSILLERSYNLHLPSIGTIRTIGVEAFGGDTKTTPNGTPYLDWGTIYPGTPTNRSLYLKSTSNVPTTLENETSNWTFYNSNNNTISANTSLAQHMHLTWNYTGTTLNPGQTIHVTLKLTADTTTEFIEQLIKTNAKTFNFDITIIANPTQQA